MANTIIDILIKIIVYDIFRLYPSIIFIIDGAIEITFNPIVIMLAIIINNSVFIFCFLLVEI